MAFCGQCGAELPDGARFCTACGTPVSGATPAVGAPPPTATAFPPHAPSQPASPPTPVSGPPGGKSGWIVPAIVVLAAIVIGYLLLAPANRQPASTAAPASETAAGAPATDAATGGVAPTSRTADTSVSAATLDAAFSRDPAGAATLYRGPIRVSGIIASMVQPGSTPALSMEGRSRFNFMVVNFPAGYRERLASLSKGQFVTVTCNDVRALAGTTILSGCLLD